MSAKNYGKPVVASPSLLKRNNSFVELKVLMHNKLLTTEPGGLPQPFLPQLEKKKSSISISVSSAGQSARSLNQDTPTIPKKSRLRNMFAKVKNPLQASISRKPRLLNNSSSALSSREVVRVHKGSTPPPLPKRSPETVPKKGTVNPRQQIITPTYSKQLTGSTFHGSSRKTSQASRRHSQASEFLPKSRVSLDFERQQKEYGILSPSSRRKKKKRKKRKNKYKHMNTSFSEFTESRREAVPPPLPPREPEQSVVADSEPETDDFDEEEPENTNTAPPPQPYGQKTYMKPLTVESLRLQRDVNNTSTGPQSYPPGLGFSKKLDPYSKLL